MNYEQALAWLEHRSFLGMRPGRERIDALLELMGRPQDSFRSVAVAGTNGKFSVATMTALILEELGLTVGVYTSPHLHEPTERIRIGGVDLQPREFAATLDYLVPFIELMELSSQSQLTCFEALTAMAFEAFFSRPVHAAVLECGLGGLYDATGAAVAEVAVVTSIGLDHIPQFGRDLSTAALEKVGIVKEGAKLVVGDCPPELTALMVSRGIELGASRVDVWDNDFSITDRYPAAGGQTLIVQTREASYDELFLPLFGRQQAINAALAIAVVELFVSEALDPNAVRAALSKVELPARFQIIDRHPLVIVDTAHNPAAVESVLTTLRSDLEFDSLTVVWGTLRDKPLQEVAQLLAQAATTVIVCETDDPRSATINQLIEALDDSEARNVIVSDDVAAAVAAARAAAAPTDAILIVGSFALAATTTLKVSK